MTNRGQRRRRRRTCWVAFGCGVLLLAPPGTGGADEDEAAARLASGASWQAFCERLAEEGKQILRDDLPSTPSDRAAGYRYLLQRLAVSIDEVLDAHIPQPQMKLYSHRLYKYGMDSADAKYTVARIDPKGTYRLYGELGTAHHIVLQLISSRPGYAAFDSLGLSGLREDAEGRFEVLLGAERPPDWKGAFVPIDSRARELLVREYFYDWQTETDSTLMIERLDAVPAPRPPRAAEMDALLSEVGDALAAYVPRWFDASNHPRTHLVNRLSPPARGPVAGLYDNAYGSGWFELDADHVLLIELDEPDAHLWSFELGNFWWESIDYVNATSSLNGDQAVKSSDGRYRLVIALEDPGVPNWLDPAGNREGVIIYRYQLARGETPVPTARLIEKSQLRQALPADTPHVNPAARRAEIEMRRRHAARRWAP